VPSIFEAQGFARMVTKRLGWTRRTHLTSGTHRAVVTTQAQVSGHGRKILEHTSSPTLISVVEALKHGGIENEVRMSKSSG
jgi:hypothetical protein